MKLTDMLEPLSGSQHRDGIGHTAYLMNPPFAAAFCRMFGHDSKAVMVEVDDEISEFRVDHELILTICSAASYDAFMVSLYHLAQIA